MLFVRRIKIKDTNSCMYCFTNCQYHDQGKWHTFYSREGLSWQVWIWHVFFTNCNAMPQGIVATYLRLCSRKHGVWSPVHHCYILDSTQHEPPLDQTLMTEAPATETWFDPSTGWDWGATPMGRLLSPSRDTFEYFWVLQGDLGCHVWPRTLRVMQVWRVHPYLQCLCQQIPKVVTYP
jgi:hypothetical protein